MRGEVHFQKVPTRPRTAGRQESADTALWGGTNTVENLANLALRASKIDFARRRPCDAIRDVNNVHLWTTHWV